jgi:hypothetical protein
MSSSAQFAESRSPSHNGLSDAVANESRRNRKIIMKSIIRIVTVLAVAAAFVFNASAADGPKEGKGKGPIVVPGENILMTCSHCKDDYVVKLTKSAKGSEAEKAVIGKHLCEKCSTTLVTKGAGKAKTEVAEHTCKGCKS